MKFFDIEGWNYSSEDYIGGGGQGKVYTCRHENYKGVYAIKVFLLRYERWKKKKRLRIEDEIKSLKSINHKNIIKYIDSGSVERNDIYYIVMEKADTSLKDYSTKKKLTFRNKIDIFRQVIEGIKILQVHKPIIIHRDLKPANLLIKNGILKITDFGIVFFSEDVDVSNRKTPLKEIVGSFNWRSPQTELGRQNKPTVQEDFYSMGKILYFLLSDGKELYREYFNSEEFFLPYINKDPKYIFFDDFFNLTIAANPRDIFDSIDSLSEEFEKACRLFINFSIDEEVEELIRLAHVFHMKRQYENHEEVLSKAISLNKNNYYAQYYYGRFLLSKNKKEEGWKFLYEVVNSECSDYYILAHLSQLLFHHDNFELSEKVSQISITLKEKGIPAKILDGSSKLTQKYMKYLALGRQGKI